MKRVLLIVVWTVFMLAFAVDGLASARIKDIADLSGARDNQLLGQGLVIGLNGTGDGTSLASLIASNMLEELKISVSPEDLSSGNIAAVTLTANLPAFVKPGTRIDVTVASIGDASSLQGGVLIQTPLYGADGNVYAVAQGTVSVGGFSVEGAAAKVQKNHPTTGRVPNGALVEKEVPVTLLWDGRVQVSLRHPDFTSASHMVEAINAKFPESALAEDAATVWVKVPDGTSIRKGLVSFIAGLEEITVETDVAAKIVINERTGTIVAGECVKIETVAVSHGNLAITVTETPGVSQPAPFSRGETTTVPRTELNVVEQPGALHLVPSGVNVADIAKALNALGVTPRDMIAIFQAIKEAGALHAELVIM